MIKNKRRIRANLKLGLDRKRAYNMSVIRIGAHLMILLTSFFCKEIHFGITEVDKSLYYYVFSTIAQSLAAVFAIMGTYLIFRLNSIDNIIEHLEDEILQLLNDKKYNRIKIYTRTNIPLLYNMEHELLEDQSDKIKYVMLMNEHKSIEDNRKHVIKISIFPLIYSAFVVFMAIVLIPFSQVFHFHPVMGKMGIVFILAMTGWAMIECLHYLYPEKETGNIEVV